MKAEVFSAIAAAASAICALFTIYMFRAQGKGFVWTKDHLLNIQTDQKGQVHMTIEIPLFNLGKGNIQFLSLKAKKINLSNKAMENFVMDMHEAYFPENVLIVTYRTVIDTFIKNTSPEQLLLVSTPASEAIEDPIELQNIINKKLGEIPEHIVIIKCTYKDGSWFGKKIKETVIGLSVSTMSIQYLSTARRKELDEYFSW